MHKDLFKTKPQCKASINNLFNVTAAAGSKDPKNADKVRCDVYLSMHVCMCVGMHVCICFVFRCAGMYARMYV
jgi:hypothetical protein